MLAYLANSNAPIATMIKPKGFLIFTMGGIGQNMQLQSDGSEIVCAIRAPYKTYAYQMLWQIMSYFASYGKKWVCQTFKFKFKFFIFHIQ